MPPPLQLKGMSFGELVVLDVMPDRCPHGNRKWLCQCSCGKTTIVIGGSLTSGNTKSCGHLSVLHGGANDREFEIWGGIQQRCHNPKHPKYPTYGARGIKVCERWRQSYLAFLEDMGRRPFDGAQIDRIDNDGDYAPGNCRWVTAKQNARNRRSSRMITHDGETLTLAEWSERLGLSPSSIIDRIKNGWTESQAVSTPSQKRGDNDGIITNHAK